VINPDVPQPPSDEIHTIANISLFAHIFAWKVNFRPKIFRDPYYETLVCLLKHGDALHQGLREVTHDVLLQGRVDFLYERMPKENVAVAIPQVVVVAADAVSELVREAHVAHFLVDGSHLVPKVVVLFVEAFD